LGGVDNLDEEILQAHLMISMIYPTVGTTVGVFTANLPKGYPRLEII